jgi:small subunit ribosomal protein S19
MGRSTKKGPYIDEKVQKKITKLNQSGEKKVVKTWARDCTIAPDFVGHTFAVHNGRKFLPVFITEQMVGHRLGEFSPTRFFKGHGAAHTKGVAELT